MPITTTQRKMAASAATCDLVATARTILYDWHGGQFSALYAAASSGLVEDKDRLLCELDEVAPYSDLEQHAIDWIKEQLGRTRSVTVQGREYLALPWSTRA